MPERNQFTKHIVRIIDVGKVGVRSFRDNNTVPGLRISVAVNRPHILGLYSGGLAEHRGLHILGHDIISHLRQSYPLDPRTSLVAMPDFVSRPPATGSFQDIRITHISHSCLIISRMISSCVHKRVIHDIEIDSVPEHLAIFLQAKKLHFTVSNLIIKINQFITVCSSILPEIIGLKCQMRIPSHHIKIFIRSFTQQFIPTPPMLYILRIKITVHRTRSKMNLYRPCRFRLYQCLGMIHHIHQSLSSHCQLINTLIQRIRNSSETITSRHVQILYLHSDVLSVCITHHYYQSFSFFHRDSRRIIKKAVRIRLVGFRLDIRIWKRLIVCHTEISVILILEHVIRQILEKRIFTILDIRFRDSHFQVATRFILKKSGIIKSIQILGIKLHFGTGSKSLTVSRTAFHDKTERLSPNRIVKSDSGSCCRPLKILVKQLRKYISIFRILNFHLLKITIIP